MRYGRTNVRLRRTNYRGARLTRNVAAQKIGRAARVALARKTNQPVARIQRQRARPMTKVMKNTASVAVLSRQVRSLQRAQIGLLQRHVMDVDQFLIPEVTPAIFSVLNFEHLNNHILEYRHSTVAPYVNTVTLTTFAAAQDQLGQTPGQTAQAAALDPYKFYKTATDDQVPQDSSYVPISTNLLVSLETIFQAASTDTDRWVLIMFIQQKAKTIKRTTNIHHYNLPEAATGLTYLASTDPFERLPFPSQYYKVLVKKWVKLHNPPQNIDRTVTRTFNMKFQYPHQYVNNDHSIATNPVNPGGPVIYDTFDSRIPVGQNVFCIIQCSRPNAITCKLRKTDVWRDPHGNQ